LAGLAEARTGAAGPLVWLGLFDEPRTIAADDVSGWLAGRAAGTASLGPLDPQLSPGGYVEAFEALQEAIRAGDIDQANLTFPLAGSFKGEPLALYAALRGDALSGYGGAVFDGQHWVLSFSSELSFRSKGSAGNGALDVVRTLFSSDAITGTPRIRAMELAAAFERDARGPSCGAIGRIDPSGDAAFNVAIRTLRLTAIENGHGTAVLPVGSAIVADSEPFAEWRESLAKASFAGRSVAGFDLVEAMKFDPETGVEFIEFHLERMKASAGALGFEFDRHATRNRIQALCFDLESPAKVRLLLARSGAIALEAQPLGETPAEATCIALPLPVDPGDPRLAHKTSDRWFYDAGTDAARDAGADAALFVRDDGLVTEAMNANVFVERDGVLLTPPAALGLLPGVLRRSLIEAGKAREAELTLGDLAGGFLLGNAVRGLVPARLL
jgi:para-aminobenzoate synthetase/4-amino-4-deoxychorismate lyase